MLARLDAFMRCTEPLAWLVVAACLLLAGCSTPKPKLDGPVRFECDTARGYVRIIPDPLAPRASAFELPINPCGFKS